jgi:D-alanine--poly(phosphoribitol) ligase subunit 2
VTVPTTLQERISRLILDGLNLEVPSTDTDLFETGVLDSMAFVDLLFRVEQQFGVRVSIEDLEIDRFRSIDRIAEFVASRMGLDGASSRGGGERPRPPADGGR